MKIAMIGQKGIPAKYGGVERHVHELSTRLACFGHDVTVYGRSWYTSGQEDVFRGVKRKNTRGFKTKHLDAITHTLTATIHAVTRKYDIIHYHAVGPALLSWIPRIFSPKTKVITTFHCIDRYHQKWGWLARFALRMGELAACTFAHKTVVVSQTLKQYCLNEFHTDAVYIPNGVTKQDGGTSGSDHLAQFGLEKGKYFIMVSRLVKHKGAHLLIEAFLNLKKKNTHNPQIQNLKLAIVGGSSHTDAYVQELHKQALHNVDVVFTGYQSGEALRELYINSSALIHPSMNEGLPITVLEAMSYAKPVLLSDIPEHLELITDKRATFAENSVVAIELAIESFLTLSGEEKKEMGTMHLEKVSAEFDWDVIVKDIKNVYENQKNSMGTIVSRVQV